MKTLQMNKILKYKHKRLIISINMMDMNRMRVLNKKQKNLKK